jgi:ABC-type polysaccharide/polyol phosphate transport system ATPase subunit
MSLRTRLKKSHSYLICIIVKPDILLIDEVYAVGDINFRIKCLDYISKFIDKGGSLIFVTHETEGIEKICNNGICLKQGKIISKYSLNDAISCYLSDSE